MQWTTRPSARGSKADATAAATLLGVDDPFVGVFAPDPRFTSGMENAEAGVSVGEARGFRDDLDVGAEVNVPARVET